MRVSRNKKSVEERFFSKSLCCYPPENEAAKIFAAWLSEHPNVSPDDVDMRIDSYEREEDHYGNGGGYDRYMRIYKYRPESDEEQKDRIADEEKEVIDDFMKNIRHEILQLVRNFDIYPNMVSDAITAHTKEIEDAILDVVKEKIYIKH